MAKKYQTNVAKFDDKGKLTEAFVQRVVRDKLNQLYYAAPTVYCAEEVYTIEGKKADVLLAFNRQGGGTYICAVEAKSKRTLNSLKPDSSDFRQLWWSRGILVVVAFVALLAYGRALVLDLLECFCCWWVYSVASITSVSYSIVPPPFPFWSSPF